ncbi:MAG: beta-ketoacyl-ACP synthase III [Kiritimatiellia bacterium]|nr:beta-ketoacyl-ACP synthase III [Kiritimatiellia bacterium]
MTPHTVQQSAVKISLRPVSVVATGSYVPERVLTNAELARMVDTSDEWITTRTGIKERRIAAPGEFTSDLAVKAAQRAMQKAGVSAEAIDLIIVATITPDMPFPSTACFVQEKLKAYKAVCFDIQAACSGFIYGLEIARQFITSGTANTALVIASEKLSGITDWQDRSTCVLFGDGAGAAVVKSRPGSRGIFSTTIGSNGNLTHLLNMPGGGSVHPASQQTVKDRLHYLKMAGKEVFKYAVNAMLDAANQALQKAAMTIDDVDLIIPHQANVRIVQAIGNRLGAPVEKYFLNLERYGNMSAASVPVALDEAVQQGVLKRHDVVLLVAFGGGFTWGATLLEW